MVLFVVIVVVLLTNSACDGLSYVYINGDNGTDVKECLSSNSTQISCKTLSFVAKNMKPTADGVSIDMTSELLDLNEPVEFQNFTHLTLSGHPSTINCSYDTEAGLAFVSVEDLTIESLSIVGCGAERMSTAILPTKNTPEYLLFAVYIVNCTDVSVNNSNITSSNGRGLAMYDTNGRVSLNNSNFNKNRVFNESSQIGGGGVYIEFTFCGVGKVSHCENHKAVSNSQYSITNCTFSSNRANIFIVEETIISPQKPLSVPRIGKGGGMYISIGSNATNNSFTIRNCTFYDNSATLVGGAMLVELLNSVVNTKVSLSDTRFIENHCIGESNCSAGLVVGFMFYNQLLWKGKAPENNTFECSFCTFDRNRGGGLIIFSSRDNRCPCKYGTTTFISSNWTENTSPMGAAVFITPGAWDYANEGCLPVPKFVNCRFVKNSALQFQPSFISGVYITVTSIGFGAMAVNHFKVVFDEYILFKFNNGTALHISNSVVEIYNDTVVEFIGNTAHKGGAIAMYGTSVLQFHENTSFNFIGNIASLLGGAIYVEFDAAFHPEYHNCFVQPASQVCKKSEVTFNFQRNIAKGNGPSIYATTFRPCAYLCHIQYSTAPEEILKQIAHFVFHDTSPLATRPIKFILNTPGVEMIPSVGKNLPLSVSDETGAMLTGVVYEANLNTSNNMSIDPAFSQVSHNAIVLLGAPNERAELQLLASGADVVLSLNVSLVDCQPGYLLNGSKCVCGFSYYLGLVGCNPFVKIKQGYWMGFCSMNETELCTTFCPNNFCSYNNTSHKKDSYLLPNKSSLLDAEICGPTRTGRVCGECAENYSVFFHSEAYMCGEESLCYLGWLFYLISQALPLILLFIIILHLNISFTDGNINCFVLYAQVVDFLSIDANGEIEYVPFVRVTHTILKQIYRPFNLEFFTFKALSFCLWRGANVLDVMTMKSATVGLALVLVLTTILLAKFQCSRFKLFSKFRTPRSVLIHGLSVFFVLCYSQGARLSFYILTFDCLYSKNFKCKTKIVFLAGNLNYLEGDHVKYAIVAILNLILMVIMPPFLLLLYPLIFKVLGICKLSESRFATFLWRLMPIQILDAFQSSFKDKYRFFAGLYFLYRGIILATYACSGTDLQFYSAIQLELMLALAVHAIFQPYKKREHNIIDALLFTNLAVINAITLFNYTRKDLVGKYMSQSIVAVMEFVQVLLVLIPFLCLLIYIVIKWVKKKKNKTNNTDDLPPLRSGKYKPLIQN